MARLSPKPVVWLGSTENGHEEGLRRRKRNVFADLGHARPEEAAAKAELAHKIAKIIERRKLTQAEAADVLEVDQPKVSALKRGKLSGFSLDRLVRFLVLLGSDVEIVVKNQPRSRRRAKLLVA